jgi:oligopeptide transport system substrate-binding protein
MMKRLTKLAVGVAIAGLISSAAFAEGVYNRGNSADPESLDPHKTSTVYEAHILRDLFEGLVVQDQHANLIPGAAESWTVSDDGTVYTFKMREGATWSNGDPVTADDFVYSFQRLQIPETAAEYASMLYVIKNAEAVNKGEMQPEELGVRAIDPQTLEITLNAPTPYFLEMLAHQSNFPVHRASIEELGDAWIQPGNLVSNGAFTLSEFVPGDHITIVKNPSFHDAENVALDQVNYIPTEDRSTALKRFEAGELDTNDDMPLEQLEDIQARLGDKVRIGPYIGTYYYVVKMQEEPWSDPEIRRAISMAIDRDFLAEEVWTNAMIPAYGMVPPGVEGYESYTADYADMDQIEREDEAARILEEHGYGPDNPLPLEIRFNTSENHQNTAVAIQEQLRPLGVEVTMLNTDTATHYGHLEQKGDFDYARAGWIADYKDPETFLGISRAASGNNYADFNNPEFERLMDEATAAGGNPEERFRLLHEAEKILVDELPNMPLLFYRYKLLISDKIKGFEENVMDVHPSRFISKEG